MARWKSAIVAMARWTSAQRPRQCCERGLLGRQSKGGYPGFRCSVSFCFSNHCNNLCNNGDRCDGAADYAVTTSSSWIFRYLRKYKGIFDISSLNSFHSRSDTRSLIFSGYARYPPPKWSIDNPWQTHLVHLSCCLLKMGQVLAFSLVFFISKNGVVGIMKKESLNSL